MKTSFIILFFISVTGTVFSQNSLSVRLITISGHPFADANLSLHQNPLDNTGYLTFEPGLIFSYDRYIKKKFSFRFSTAVFNDRFNLLSGYSQAMIKYKIMKYYKHSIYFGLGPAVHYTTEKSSVEGYVNEENYKTKNDILYKISWFSGLVEYNYYINKKTDFALALNHIHPRSIAISLGVRFDLPDPSGKGCNCPGYR